MIRSAFGAGYGQRKININFASKGLGFIIIKRNSQGVDHIKIL